MIYPWKTHRAVIGILREGIQSRLDSLANRFGDLYAALGIQAKDDLRAVAIFKAIASGQLPEKEWARRFRKLFPALPLTRRVIDMINDGRYYRVEVTVHEELWTMPPEVARDLELAWRMRDLEFIKGRRLTGEERMAFRACYYADNLDVAYSL